MEPEELIEKAKESYSLSYSPYSKQKVGAAVLTVNGKVFQAANIENSSFSLAICAERLAVFNALLGGEKPLMVAVAAEGQSSFLPCGACLQVIAEFSPQAKIVFYYRSELKVLQLKDLLTHPFSFSK